MSRMKQENEGPREWPLRNAIAMKTFQLWGPRVSVYTYVKGFFIEEGEDLFQVFLKGSPMWG